MSSTEKMTARQPITAATAARKTPKPSGSRLSSPKAPPITREKPTWLEASGMSRRERAASATAKARASARRARVARPAARTAPAPSQGRKTVSGSSQDALDMWLPPQLGDHPGVQGSAPAPDLDGQRQRHDGDHRIRHDHRDS